MVRFVNDSGIPDTFWQYAVNDDYDAGKSWRTATQLIDEPQVVMLRKKHDNDITLDVADAMPMLLGKAVHHISEKGQTNRYATEKRVFTKVHGALVSAQTDIIERLDDSQHLVNLIEHKVTGTFGLIVNKDRGWVKPEWEKQVNLQAEIIERATNLMVGDAHVCVILRDWMRSKAVDNDYPNRPILMVPIPLWSKDERAKYLEDRVRVHMEAELHHDMHGTLPECSDEGRWSKPAVWAVEVPKRKSALRLLSTREEAEKWIKESDHPAKKQMTIVERQGEHVRCAGDWCSVSTWCVQHKKHIEEQAVKQLERRKAK